MEDTINIKLGTDIKLLNLKSVPENMFLNTFKEKDKENDTISNELDTTDNNTPSPPKENDIISNELDTTDSIYYDTLVLSGGSTKGFIILGAIQYAYDNFILKDIKKFVGTSCGSMIGYLLAIGYTPIEIVVYICTNQLLEKIPQMNIVAMIQGRGASSYNIIQEQMEKMTIAKIGYLPTLNDIKEKYDKTLVCVTHNLTENKTEYLSWETHPHLPCITAIRMSSNLPLVFENFRYGDFMYVDGAISDNFAIDVAEKIGEKVLGLLLESANKGFSNDPDINTLDFIYKLIFVPIKQATIWKIKNKKDKTRIIRLIHNTNIKAFQLNINSKTILEMFSFGYENMRKEFE